MKVASSQFKAKMAHYLRLIKAGEEIEILERGIPVACIASIKAPESEPLIIKAQEPIEKLQSMVFTTHLPKDTCDIVEFLLEEREKR